MAGEGRGNANPTQAHMAGGANTLIPAPVDRTLLEELKKKYYCGVNTVTAQEFKTLCKEVQLALKGQPQHANTDILVRLGQRKYPERNHLRGSDLKWVKDDEVEEWNNNGREDVTGNVEQRQEVQELRPNWWPFDWQPLPPAVMGFQLTSVEHVREGMIYWLFDAHGDKHLGVAIDVDYGSGRTVYLELNTFGGNGIHNYLEQRHLFVPLWHPDSQGSWDDKISPFEPVRWHGPGGSNFPAQFSDKMFLRLRPDTVPLWNMYCAVGCVSPATLKWLRACLAKCDDLGVPPQMKAAAAYISLEKFVQAMKPHTDERVRDDHPPPAGEDFEHWRRTCPALQNNRDSITAQWDAEPKGFPTKFIASLTTICEIIDTVCPADLRLDLVVPLSQPSRTFELCRCILDLAGIDEAFKAKVGPDKLEITRTFMTQLEKAIGEPNVRLYAHYFRMLDPTTAETAPISGERTYLTEATRGVEIGGTAWVDPEGWANAARRDNDGYAGQDQRARLPHVTEEDNATPGEDHVGRPQRYTGEVEGNPDAQDRQGDTRRREARDDRTARHQRDYDRRERVRDDGRRDRGREDGRRERGREDGRGERGREDDCRERGREGAQDRANGGNDRRPRHADDHDRRANSRHETRRRSRSPRIRGPYHQDREENWPRRDDHYDPGR